MWVSLRLKKPHETEKQSSMRVSMWHPMRLTKPHEEGYWLELIFISSALLIGKWTMKVGTRKAMVTGGALYGSAFGLTALGVSMHSLPMMYAGNLLAGNSPDIKPLHLGFCTSYCVSRKVFDTANVFCAKNCTVNLYRHPIGMV